MFSRFGSQGALRLVMAAMSAAGAALVVAACSELARPTAPTAALSGTPGLTVDDQAGVASSHQHLADDKGYIDGWFNGETVQLHYTKAYFCEAPPASGADTGCEVGADPETAPRSGPIPTIYAIAWTGGAPFPDLSTFSCPPGSTCLNHPAHIDVSRVVPGPGRSNVPGLPHSHIVAEHHAGWFNTVNIRVSNPDAWNQIAAAKTLTKVRELQAAGLASADTPTNIYFFIASWH